jgi:hypothetical protein
LFGYGVSANSYRQLDRPLLSKQLQILGWFCDVTRSAVGITIDVFQAKKLVTASAWSRSFFEEQTSSSTKQTIRFTAAAFARLFPHATEMFHCALLPTAFNNDWSLEYGNETNGYLLRTAPRLFSNGSCNCLISSDCQQPLRVGPPDLILPGLVIGCSPLDGLRLSTLECFYSSECIANITRYLEYYTEMDGSPPVNFTPPTSSPMVMPPMNRSAPSRFFVNTPINTLITEVFIERWSNTSSYNAYFATCAPIECRYEYVARNDLLYVVTALLGLYGGLTVSLRFITWNLTRIYQWAKARFCTGRPFRAWM